MSNEIEPKKKKSPPARLSRRIDRWVVSRAVNKLIAEQPHLGDLAYRGRVVRYVRLSILLERFLDAFNSDVELVNDRGELHESFDMIRRYAETCTKLEKHLYTTIPRTERQAESLESLRRAADEADAAEANESEDEAF